MSKELRAFHGDPAIQAKYIARVEAHYAADEIIHGTYWERGKGCAVGCTVHSAKHAAYEKELGVPMILARLEDRIFEGMTNGDSKEFPGTFLRAIPLGADLSGVWDGFALWLMIDPKFGVRQYVKDGTPRAAAIEKVAGLFRRKVDGGKVAKGEWIEARNDAAAAYAAYAADAAAYAADAAAYAADAAADAAAAYAADAAADAAYDAAYAAAYAAARQKFWKAAAAKLIELLAAAPVPVPAGSVK